MSVISTKLTLLVRCVTRGLIEILKDYVTLVFEGDLSTIPVRKEMLAEAIEALNTKSLKLPKAADYLQWKIDNYDTHMTPTEEN